MSRPAGSAARRSAVSTTTAAKSRSRRADGCSYQVIFLSMNIYVSLFGAENYAWPRCLQESVIVTVVDDDLFPFWERQDRAGFVDYAIQNKKTRRGNVPNRQTASRWYGLIQNIVGTEGDYWVHRSGDDIWWTISGTEISDYVQELGPANTGTHVFRKSCAPWSNKDMVGRPLRWSSLHPKAKNILSTQSTQIALGDENRDYVLALLRSGNLGNWHESSCLLY